MISKSLLNDLVRMGKLQKQKTDSGYINGLIDGAHRNIRAALLLQHKVDEAAFKLMYDGLLQISRAVVMIKGYRPDDGEQHKTTFTDAGIFLGEELEEIIGKIQKYRIKRNDCIYQPKDLIGKTETEAILKTAREFWPKAKKYLEGKNSQLRLFEI